MKTLKIIALLALMPGCADAQSTTAETNLDITGDSLPAISHIVEMKMSSDTLLFVYESKEGYGQRFLRRAVIGFGRSQLKASPDAGKLNNGYYVSYMPYPSLPTTVQSASSARTTARFILLKTTLRLSGQSSILWMATAPCRFLCRDTLRIYLWPLPTYTYSWDENPTEAVSLQ